MYENKTYEQIKADILAKIEGIDKREGSFTDAMVSPVSMELEGCYKQFETMLGTMFLTDTSGEYLDKRAGEYGLKRKHGTPAICRVMFTGVPETVVPKGSLVGTASNMLFRTSEETVTGSAVQAVSEEAGSRYNVPSGALNRLPVAIPGVTAVTNPQGAAGGTDLETDDNLLKRVLFQLQNPATSGNPTHYKIWATEVSGISDARVFPLWNGNGTVKVMPLTSDKRAPDTALLSKVAENIEAKRPIGAEVSVTAPDEVAVNVTARISKSPDYTTEEIKQSYTKSLTDYIKGGVFTVTTIDYFKCLSIMYEVPGVVQVSEFTLNGGTVNIPIAQTEIQVPGTVIITL